MIGSLRKFASSKFAGILIGLIIIPFVFMGMGRYLIPAIQTTLPR